MTQRHTPGPWNVSGQSEGGKYISVSSLTGVVARVPFSRDEANPTDHSDACLIAAAPELLEAAQKTLHEIRQLCETVNVCAKKAGLGRKVREEDFGEPLRAAIAKAESV